MEKTESKKVIDPILERMMEGPKENDIIHVRIDVSSGDSASMRAELERLGFTVRKVETTFVSFPVVIAAFGSAKR